MKKRKYTDRWSLVPLALSVVLFASIAVWAARGVREASRLSDEEGLRIAQQAVERAVVSYYALEGVYPATYEDLKEWSGLAVDEDKYIVIYDIFASNIRPSVTVMERRVEAP